MSKVIAIDLGGTNLRAGIVDDNLNILKAIRERSTHDNTSNLYQQIKSIIVELLSTNLADGVSSIGISCAGFCENGTIKLSPNLNIGNFNLVNLLQKDFPKIKNIVLANDANASALMEAKYGAGQKYNNIVFVTISSGIGLGLVINKKLIDLPFEVGHNYIYYKNRYYELEQLISGNGLMLLSNINGLKVDSAAELFKLIYEKNINARKVYEEWLKLTGSFLANLQLDYNLDAIVLSGGVMQSKEFFLDDLISVANAFIAPFPTKSINICEAKFDQDTGLISGASLVLSN